KRLSRRAFDLEDVAVGAAEILPAESVPTARLADEFDACGAKLFACCCEIVDLKGDDRGSRNFLLLLVAAKNLQLIAGSRFEDRLSVAFDPDFEPKHVPIEGHASIEIIGRDADPRKAFHLHAPPPYRAAYGDHRPKS